MSQSLTKLYVHLVTSTKYREPTLSDDIRPRLFEYLGGILRELDCPSIVWGGVCDHVHGLFCLSKKLTLIKVVEEVKKSSSKWLKTLGSATSLFHWQAGYGAFSVSQSVVPTVEAYIRNQEQHHKKTSFQEEYRLLLRKHGVEFDERYVWD